MQKNKNSTPIKIYILFYFYVNNIVGDMCKRV